MAVLLMELHRRGDLELLAVTGDLPSCLAQAERSRPEVVLAEVGLPGPSGLQLAYEVRTRWWDMAVVLVAPSDEDRILEKAMRRGAVDVLVQPLEVRRLLGSIQAAHRLAVEARRRAGHSPGASPAGDGEVLLVASPAGGVGKTLLSAALALHLAAVTPQRVALVDLDAQSGDLDLVLGLETGPPVAALAAAGPHIPAEMIDAALRAGPHGLQVLSLAGELQPSAGLGPDQLPPLLARLRAGHGLTVVDTAAHVDDLLLALLREADRLLLVTTPDLTAVRAAARMLNLIDRLGTPAREQVRLAINRTAPSAPLGPGAVAQLLGFARFVAVPELPAVGALLAEGRGLTELPGALGAALDPLLEPRGAGHPQSQPGRGPRRRLERLLALGGA